MHKAMEKRAADGKWVRWKKGKKVSRKEASGVKLPPAWKQSKEFGSYSRNI